MRNEFSNEERLRGVRTALSFLFIFCVLLVLSPSKGEIAHKAKLDVIVLDAGHGGKDAGAIGTNGYMEKQGALGIVLKLGKLIEKELPGVKVVYTRKDDRFIELYRRGAIANENHGKLFICVHCNSTPQKPSKAFAAWSCNGRR